MLKDKFLTRLLLRSNVSTSFKGTLGKTHCQRIALRCSLFACRTSPETGSFVVVSACHLAGSASYLKIQILAGKFEPTTRTNWQGGFYFYVVLLAHECKHEG